jgi:hypothetical protein
MKTMNYEPMCGDNIAHTVRHTARLSKTSGCRVRFSFNGVTLQATPKKSPVTLLWEWERINGQHAEKYRLSKKGQDAHAIRTAETARLKTQSETLLMALSSILLSGSTDELMGWLKSFALVADDVSVKLDTATLAAKFEAAGFKENEGVGQKPEWFNTRPRMASYIVGQVINCLKRGMPPHPVTVSFVEKYQALSPVS